MKDRPNPEKLLDKAKAEALKAQQGKLKIYLGAAPGVGKTYTMLHDAIQEHNKGLDVVIGIVESHGRQEINNLCQQLESLPKQTVEYSGKLLEEFDLDGVLNRHPGLVLIDELAHTNVPGLRHEKRWQDIKEILDRGINVCTTLNVQHIESLKDKVAQIIQAPIYETVPDSLLDMAETVELVDIPPEELLIRLREGVVYIPDQAKLAVTHFFRKGNLIALRELALRTMAELVESQVLLYRKGEGITRIWPTNDKILVCIGPGMESLKLIRAARRMAMSLQAQWIAIYVESPRLKSTEETRNQAIQHLRVAEELGAQTRVLTGFDIVKEIMKYAREENVTQIMIWKHIRTRWRDVFFKCLADEVVRHSGEIDVYIMTGDIEPTKTTHTIPVKKPIVWKIYGISLGIVALATVFDFLVSPYLSGSNLIMVYLLGVTLIALFGQAGPAILCSILSVLLYDFFFVPPVYSFAVSNIQYAFTFVVMLIVSLIISHLTILTRRHAMMMRLEERQMSVLYTFSRQLSSVREFDELMKISTKYLSNLFHAEVLVVVPEDNLLVIGGSSEMPHNELSEKEQSLAQWVYDLGQKAGLGTGTLPLFDAIYIPLQGRKGVMGVLKIRPRQKGKLFTPDDMRLLEACANQIAIVLEADRNYRLSKEG
jgi:two-component system sensor histidine kinase KdpD